MFATDISPSVDARVASSIRSQSSLCLSSGGGTSEIGFGAFVVDDNDGPFLIEKRCQHSTILVSDRPYHAPGRETEIFIGGPPIGFRPWQGSLEEMAATIGMCKNKIETVHKYLGTRGMLHYIETIDLLLGKMYIQLLWGSQSMMPPTINLSN